MWIEVKEQYDQYDKEDLDRYDSMGIPLKKEKAKTKIRRKLLRLQDVFSFDELDNNFTEVVFYDGTRIIVKGNIDDMRALTEDDSEEDYEEEIESNEDMNIDVDDEYE